MSDCQRQLQLLAQIDGYRSSFVNPFGTSISDVDDLQRTAYAELHFILTRTKPSEKSSYSSLKNYNTGVFSENFGGEFDNMCANVSKYTESYEALQQFVNENQQNLSKWYATTVLTVKEDEGRAKKLVQFLNKLSENITRLQSDDKETKTIFTPLQILMHLEAVIVTFLDQTLAKVIGNLDEKGGKKVKAIGKYLRKFATNAHTAIEHDDFLLSSVSADEYMTLRTKIADFAFFATFLEPIMEGVSLNAPMSEILYFFDKLFVFRNAVAPASTTQIDVCEAAELVHLSIQNIMSLTCPTVMSLNDQLMGMDAMFNDISDAYQDSISMRPTASRLIEFLNENKEDFEMIIRKLIDDHVGQLAHDFLVAFYQLVTALKHMEFQNEMCVFDPATLSKSVENTKDQLADLKKSIREQKIISGGNMEIMDFLALFVNPSRKGRGVLGSAESAELGSLMTTIDTHKTDAENISHTDVNLSANMKKIAKDIAVLGYAVDKFLPNDELIEKYHDCVKALNSKLAELIEFVCIHVDDYTPRMAVQMTIQMLMHVNIELEKVTHVTDTNIVDEAKNKIGVVTEMLEFYEKLDAEYSESKLIAAKEQIESDIETFSSSLMLDAKTFDHTARDCYLRNICNYVLPALMVMQVFVYEMVEQEYSLIDAIKDLNNADMEFKLIAQKLAYNRHDLESKQLLGVISTVMSTLSSIQMSLTTTVPRQVVGSIAELRVQLEALPELIKTVDGAISCGQALSLISAARWKLTHLKSYYEYDKDLYEVLKPVRDGLEATTNLVNDDEKREIYENMLGDINGILLVISATTERTGEEPQEYIELFRNMIHEITTSYEGEKTCNAKSHLEEVRVELNNAIVLLKGAPVELLPFIDPMEEFRGTWLEGYIAAASKQACDAEEFFVAGSSAMSSPDTEKLGEGKQLLDNFINTTDVDYFEIQSKLAIPMLWYLTVAHDVKYEKMEQLMQLAVEFQKSDPMNLSEFCFELSALMHNLHKKVGIEEEKDKDAVSQILLESYQAKNNDSLADTVYYTSIYASMVPEADRSIFLVLTDPLMSCFHCRNTVSSRVDATDAVKYLKGSKLDPSKLAKFDAIVKEQEEINGIQVVAIHEEEEKQQEPEEEPVVEEKVSDVFPEEEEKKQAPLPPLPVRKQLLLQRSGIMMTVQNLGGPVSWVPVITATATDKPVDKKLAGEAGWTKKSLATNCISYHVNKRTNHHGEFKNVSLENEFALPANNDKGVNGDDINTQLVSQSLRWLSRPKNDVAIENTNLDNVFDNDFRNLRSIKLPSAFKPEEGEMDPVFAQLSKAVIGDNVERINTAATTKEALLKSFIPAVYRFIEIASPQNMDAFTEFLAFFNKDDVSDMFNSWLWTCFNARTIARDILSRFLTSAATLIRCVVNIDDTDRHQILLNSIEYIIKIATALVLSKASKKNSTERILATNARASAVADFCDAVARAIVLFGNYDKGIDINTEFAIFLDVVGAFSDPASFYQTYLSYIWAMRIGQPTSSDIDKLSGKTYPTIRFARATMERFASNRNFIIELAGQSSNLIATMCDMCVAAFYTQDNTLIKRYTLVFAELVSHVEGTANAEAIATAMLPMLHYATQIYSSAAFTEKYSIVEHFIAPLLLVLRSAKAENIVAYLHSLSEEEERNIYDMLRSMIGHLLTYDKLPSPFAGVTADDKASELEQLKGYAKIAKKKLNYAMFNELTKRVARFLVVMTADGPFRANVMPAVSHLIVALFNRHQDKANYELLMNTLSKFINANEKVLFVSSRDSVHVIISLAFDLLTRRLMVAKACAISIIVHVMFTDYFKNKSTATTSSIVLDLYAEGLMAAPRYKEEIFNSFIGIFYKFTRAFAQKKFVDTTDKQAKDSATLAPLIVKLKKATGTIEKASIMISIAFVFTDSPLKVINWLRKAITVLCEGNFFAQAYVATMWIAYITMMILKKTTPSLPDYDFSMVSIPDEIKNLSFPMQDVKIFSTFPDFTTENLSQIFWSAAEFAEQAGLLLHASQICNHLQVTMTKKEKVPRPFRYFVVAERKNGETHGAKVFAVKCKSTEAFIELVTDKEKLVCGLPPTTVMSYAEAEEGISNGIIVLPIRPIASPLTTHVNEFYSDGSNGRTYFTVKTGFPQISLFDEDVKIELKPMTNDEMITDEVNNAMKLLSEAATFVGERGAVFGVSTVEKALKFVVMSRDGACKVLAKRCNRELGINVLESVRGAMKVLKDYEAYAFDPTSATAKLTNYEVCAAEFAAAIGLEHFRFEGA